jgi:hypothetical protein
MEEEPNNDGQMTLMNFSFEQHGFEFSYIRDFEFDDQFIGPDEGQMQSEPTALDEQDLLSRLRDVLKKKITNHSTYNLCILRQLQKTFCR